uniref:Phosphoinositide phospholipase C n=1 Tax=Naja naja TaxID=35670 RepID=A0A8C6VDH3_NAJNA
MSVLTPILTSPEVKKYMTEGERFIKWDDESANAHPVILRVDPKGFYLYWTFQSKEIEFLDITSIRDTRVGKFAKIPKNHKLREVFNLDFPNNFLHKILTVVSGPDMVDLTFHNFVSYKENVDRKRVEAALSACHLPQGKNDGINPEDFPETVYKTFLMNLCPRPDINEIFTSHHSKAKPYMTKDHLTKFINKKQRNSHLNDTLFPPAKPDRVQGLIEKYEPSGMNIQRGQLSPEGMVWFLCGPENSIISQDKLFLYQDMNQPLSHYFINSSHNTYLTGGQFSGSASPEMYRQTLLAGCRCVELDCWKGRTPDDEPIITHGYTMTNEILFKDALEAIAESAFKISPYPVILSFENHVDLPKQQAKMAEYCRTILGDMLLTEPLEKYPLKPGVPLPSPQDLMGKILIKNKKNQFMPGENQDALKKRKSLEDEVTDQPIPTEKDSTVPEVERNLENLNEEEIKKLQSDEGTAGLEVTAYEEMSSLVNYIQPIKFESFEISAQKNHSYVVSSFTELKAYELLTRSPIQFVNYNKRQMSRIYPKGTRMDSSNYMPQMFWNVGCQMVALNFQTSDVPMQQNMALFEFNGQSGYLLKHDFMCRPDKHFDPFSVDRIDVVVASTLSITIISGQFLSERSVKSYIEVELFGLPGDPKRRYRTKVTPNANSINPIWNEDPFVFEKVTILNIIFSLHFLLCQPNCHHNIFSYWIHPLSFLGYHHVCLRSESNQPLTMPSLFVYVEMKDYVPDSWADLTMALSNPIKFFTAHDKKMKNADANNEVSSPNIFCVKYLSYYSSNQDASDRKPQTASIEEIQQMKNFGKLLKKQEKELKELERKMTKRKEELLQKYTAFFTEVVSQLGRKEMSCPPRTPRRKSITKGNAAELTENADNKIMELKEKLEEELLHLGEEQYDAIWKKKDQHAIELQQEAFAEYENKMKTISAEVQDSVKNCMKVCYPLEADTAKREAPEAASEGGQRPCGNLVTPETLRYATEVVKEEVIIDEESTDVQDSRL